MARISNRFTRGSGVFECRCCHRKTRDTGRGDNESVRLCADCYDLAGEENSLSDTDDFHSSPQNVLAMIKSVKDKGGDASCWDHLKKAAEEKLNT